MFRNIGEIRDTRDDSVPSRRLSRVQRYLGGYSRIRHSTGKIHLGRRGVGKENLTSQLLLISGVQRCPSKPSLWAADTSHWWRYAIQYPSHNAKTWWRGLYSYSHQSLYRLGGVYESCLTPLFRCSLANTISSWKTSPISLQPTSGIDSLSCVALHPISFDCCSFLLIQIWLDHCLLVVSWYR